MSRIHWVISHARLGCEQVTLGQDIACKAGVGAGHIGSGDHVRLGCVKMVSVCGALLFCTVAYTFKPAF